MKADLVTYLNNFVRDSTKLFSKRRRIIIIYSIFHILLTFSSITLHDRQGN